MAAVSPVGSQIYVNQASPLAAQLNQAVAGRFDMQAFVISEMESNKEPQIEPVVEADGSQRISAEADGSKSNQGYEEQKREKKDTAEKPHKSDHILDLKV